MKDCSGAAEQVGLVVDLGAAAKAGSAVHSVEAADQLEAVASAATTLEGLEEATQDETGHLYITAPSPRGCMELAEEFGLHTDYGNG